jgi:hypothetical protein
MVTVPAEEIKILTHQAIQFFQIEKIELLDKQKAEKLV